MDTRFSHTNNTRKPTPYLTFLKQMRAELLSSHPSLSKKQIMTAILAAWNQLSLDEKRRYREGDGNTTSKVRNRSGDDAILTRKRRCCGRRQEELLSPLQLLRKIGKVLTDYFLVRPI